MFILNIFQIIIFLYIFNCKNIVLPFKKITVETFKQNKTVNDLISYNIYTTIEVCPDSQNVGFFIDQNEPSFYLKKRLLSFNTSKSNEVMKQYQSMQSFWFDKQKSEEIIHCDYSQFCSEIFYFYTLDNQKVTVPKFRYNIYCDFIIERYKCGIIGLKNPSNIYYENEQVYIYFFDELKQNKLIDKNCFTILYDEKNTNFNYNESLYLGKLIIGESPYNFNPELFQKKDEVIVPGNDYMFLVDELKFNSPNGDYLESEVKIQISFTSGFIKGTNLYRKEIDDIFFKDLINKELCKIDYLEENLYTNSYYIYSCTNNNNVKEQIKTFPNLYMEIKTKNLTFIFTPKDLFVKFKNRIYFLIAFRDEKYSSYSQKWYVGEIFLRKYITTFNYDSKSISFNRKQIDNANLNGQIIYDEKDIEMKSNLFNIFRALLEILMGLFIIMMLYVFYRKISSKRKLHANELEDNNYIYEPKKETKMILLEKEGT